MAPEPTTPLVTFVVAIVVLVWSASVIAAILIREYSVLVYTTPICGAVVGFATGIRIGKGGGGHP